MVCKKCGNDFQSLSRNRTKCYTCSPYNRYRGYSDPSADYEPQERTCSICGRSYKRRVKYKGVFHGHASKCMSCVTKLTRQENKRKALDMFGSKCFICGYNRCSQALAFHHKEAKDKNFNISGGTRSWSVLKTELEKCVLLCHNCHSEQQAGLLHV